MGKSTTTHIDQSSNLTLKIVKSRALQLICVSLLDVMIENHAIALSAITTEKIQGSGPYFTLDGGRTKVTNSQGLLGITLSDGRHYVVSGNPSGVYPNSIENTSSVENPIVLPDGITTFTSIKTLVPLVSDGNNSYPNVSLNNLANSYGYWGDDDGDKNVQATGSLTVAWQDKNGIDITSQIKNNKIQTLDPCDAPYKLIVKATAGQLSTQYGIPNITSFNEETTSYYITPKIDSPYVCYAQPNIINSRGDSTWINNKGFKVTSISNIANNFPSTGSNGLHFYLLLAGITPEQVIAANGATISAESGGSTVNLSLTAEQKSTFLSRPQVALKVLLNGPNKASSNTKFAPSVFKLYADSAHNQLLYSFKIERWYVIKPGFAGGYDNAKVFCNNLGNGYRIPGVEDYTNAEGSSNWKGGAPGAGNYYRRQMSYKNGNKWVGGLLNEWGKLDSVDKKDYPDAQDWKNSEGPWGYDIYWASQVVYAGSDGTPWSYYDVNGSGYIGGNNPSTTTHRVVCVAP